ncbi:hypothetical protein ACJJTC_003299 [Scirpophaga incertulas]
MRCFTQRFNSFYKLDKQKSDSWRCPLCVCGTPKVGNQNTPVHMNISPDQLSNVTLRKKSTPLDNSDCCGQDTGDVSGIQSEPLTELTGFWVEMRAIREEMTLFRSAITDLTTAVKAQISRLDTLEIQIDNLEAKETITQLRLEIEESQQGMLVNDVEIANFPEGGESENATHIVLTIANKLGIALDEREVVSAWVLRGPRRRQRQNVARLNGDTGAAGAAVRGPARSRCA